MKVDISGIKMISLISRIKFLLSILLLASYSMLSESVTCIVPFGCPVFHVGYYQDHVV